MVQNLFGEDYYLEMQRHETHDPNADCTISRINKR